MAERDIKAFFEDRAARGVTDGLTYKQILDGMHLAGYEISQRWLFKQLRCLEQCNVLVSNEGERFRVAKKWKLRT